MTPASMLARKRALLQLAGGAMPDTSEVEVSEVPVALPDETPGQAEPLPRPSAPVVMDEPQEGATRDAYGDALARQRSLQLMAGLSRAGGTAIQAISGVAPDQQAASALDEQAKAPVVEYLQRMKLADTERQLGIQEAKATKPTGKAPKSTDPASEASRRWAAVIQETVPGQYTDDFLAKVTEAEGPEILKRALEAQRIETTREGQVGTEKRSEADRAERARIWAERKGLDYAKMSQQERLAAIREANKDEAHDEGEVDKLRKEFMGNKVVKDYQDSRIALDKVERAANDPSAAGDLALIFGYMKTLDPGSTVREGEFANAQNAGGIDSRIMAAYNKVLSGERLTATQRQDFIRSARTQFGAHQQAFERLRKQYGGLAPSGQGERVTLPADGLDLTAPPSPTGGRSESIKEKVDLEDGTTIITYSDGRIVKRVPKKKAP